MNINVWSLDDPKNCGTVPWQPTKWQNTPRKRQKVDEASTPSASTPSASTPSASTPSASTSLASTPPVNTPSKKRNESHMPGRVALAPRKRHKVAKTATTQDEDFVDHSLDRAEARKQKQKNIIYRNFGITEVELQSHFSGLDAPCISAYGSPKQHMADWPPRFIEKLAQVSSKVKDIEILKGLLKEERQKRNASDAASGRNARGPMTGFRAVELERIIQTLNKEAAARVQAAKAKEKAEEKMAKKQSKGSVTATPASKPSTPSLTPSTPAPSTQDPKSPTPSERSTPVAQSIDASFPSFIDPDLTFDFGDGPATYASFAVSQMSETQQCPDIGPSRLDEMSNEEFAKLIDFTVKADQHALGPHLWQNGVLGSLSLPSSSNNPLGLPPPANSIGPWLNMVNNDKLGSTTGDLESVMESTTLEDRADDFNENDTVSTMNLAHKGPSQSLTPSTNVSKRKLDAIREEFDDDDESLTADMDPADMRAMVEYHTAVENLERGAEENRPRLVRQAKSQLKKLWYRERLRLEHGVEM